MWYGAGAAGVPFPGSPGGFKTGEGLRCDVICVIAACSVAVFAAAVVVGAASGVSAGVGAAGCRDTWPRGVGRGDPGRGGRGLAAASILELGRRDVAPPRPAVVLAGGWGLLRWSRCVPRCLPGYDL